MSKQGSLFDTPNVISSPALESGPTPSESQDGLTTGPVWTGSCPCPSFSEAGKGEGFDDDRHLWPDWDTLIRECRPPVLFGEQVCMRRLDSAGSTLFAETWKRRATPLRRRYWEHTASARRTSDSGCTSVPTPQAADMTGGGQAKRALRSHRENGVAQSANLNDYAMLASVPTPMAGSPATETYNAAGNNDYSRKIVELATCATPRSEDSQCAGAHRGTADTLHAQTQLAAVPTPRAQEREQRNSADTGMALSATVLSAVPSPCCPTGGRSMSTEMMDATGKTLDGRKHTASLEHTVKFSAVSTPSARDWKDTSGMSETGVDPDGSTRSRLDQLPRQAQLADSGLTATGGTEGTKSTGQLDPAYSRWLQGLPAEWDVCADLATRSLRLALKRSSKPTSKRSAE